MAKGTDVPLKVKKDKSNDKTKPNAGDLFIVNVADLMVDGKVLHYFDDDNNTEHAYVQVGHIIVIRPTSQVNNR